MGCGSSSPKDAPKPSDTIPAKSADRAPSKNEKETKYAPTAADKAAADKAAAEAEASVLKIFKSLFDKMDLQDGFVFADQIASVIKSIGTCEMSEANSKECMEKLDGVASPVTLEKLVRWYAKDPISDGVCCWLTALRALVVKRLEAKARADAKLRDIFEKMDRPDKAGTLDVKKIAAAVKGLGCGMSKDNAKECLVALDSPNGIVTFENFLAWFDSENKEKDGVWMSALRAMIEKRKSKAPLTFLIAMSPEEAAKLRGVYDKLDSDKSGTLDFKKIASAVKGLGCEMSQDNAKAALEALDGIEKPVTFEKFSAWYVSDPANDGVWLAALRAIVAKPSFKPDLKPEKCT